MKTKLFTAISSASLVVVNGYEVDDIGNAAPEIIKLEYGDDEMAQIADQDIEIDHNVQSNVIEVESSESLALQFLVRIPIREIDLLK